MDKRGLRLISNVLLVILSSGNLGLTINGVMRRAGGYRTPLRASSAAARASSISSLCARRLLDWRHGRLAQHKDHYCMPRGVHIAGRHRLHWLPSANLVMALPAPAA